MTNESNPNRNRLTIRDRARPEANLAAPCAAGCGCSAYRSPAAAGYGILSRRSAAKLLSERTNDLAAPMIAADAQAGSAC